MNHWVVLEQCGPDTQLTIVAILDMGGAIPPSLISMAIGEMGAFFVNLQEFVHADGNQDRIRKVVEADREANQVDAKGDNSSMAKIAVESAAKRSDDILNNSWGTSTAISGGVAMMSRKPLPGAPIDPVRCIGYIRNINADVLKCVMMDPGIKKSLSELTPSPMLLFDRMETHHVQLPRVDLKEYVRTTPVAVAKEERKQQQEQGKEQGKEQEQEQEQEQGQEQGQEYSEDQQQKGNFDKHSRVLRSSTAASTSSSDVAAAVDNQQTVQSSFETCTIHLDYIQSKFPWPLASEYDGLRSWLA